MKKIVKTLTAFLVAFCVLIGQGGLVLAIESAEAAPAKCDRCPCESERPSCCVEKTSPAESPESPVIPSPETRVLSPAVFEPVPVDTISCIAADNRRVLPRQIDSARSVGVPLFLRHRAILI